MCREGDDDGEEPVFTPDQRARYEAQSPADLHARLTEVDPDTAKRLHPRDKRKIIRYIKLLPMMLHLKESLPTQMLLDDGKHHVTPISNILILVSYLMLQKYYTSYM